MSSSAEWLAMVALLLTAPACSRLPADVGEWHSYRVEVTAGDIGLVLWELNLRGGESAETIASRLPDYMTLERTSEVLREAERRGLARDLGGAWALTEAGQTYVDE
jgi:hypothetical protein